MGVYLCKYVHINVPSLSEQNVIYGYSDWIILSILICHSALYTTQVVSAII